MRLSGKHGVRLMSQSEATLIELTGSVGVAQIAELHAKVQEASSAGSEVTLDFGEVRSIDASVLQLLLASKQAMDQGAGMVSLRGLSDQLIESLESFGAGEVLSMMGASSESGSDTEPAAADPSAEPASEPVVEQTAGSD